MNTKHPVQVHIMVFGVVTSNGDIMPPIHLSTWSQTQHRSLHQVPGGNSIALDQESNCWKTLHLATELYTSRRTQSEL